MQITHLFVFVVLSEKAKHADSWRKQSVILKMTREKHATFLRQGCQFGFFEARFSNSGFFGIKKKPDKIWLFSVGKAWLWQNTVLSLHIHYISPLTRVIDHAGCTEYCKDFTVDLKMIDVIDKKQMYDSVLTRKENASEDWNCIISIFLMSQFCAWLCVYLYVYVLKLLSGSFWLFLGQGLPFFRKDNRLATPSCDCNTLSYMITPSCHSVRRKWKWPNSVKTMHRKMRNFEGSTIFLAAQTF